MTRASLIRPYVQDDHDAPGDATTGLWLDFLVQRASPHEVRLSGPAKTVPSDLKVDGVLLSTYVSRVFGDTNDFSRTDYVWDIGDGLVRAEILANSHLRIRVMTDGDAERASTVLDSLQGQLTFRRQRKANEVKMKFWRMTPYGGSAFSRNIAAPTWNSIARNYEKGASAQLAQLMHLRPKQIGTGKVLLFHGPPGGGKTTAIRALAREWRRWCQFAYAIDPERVFGDGSYLTELITDGHDDDEIPQASLSRSADDKWRLLIIEDAEEFLVPDAKHEVGQAVARLLNLGDGILGQGFRLLVLLTTNVSVEKLSPAITRPGRCLANIAVPAIPRAQASEWLGHPVKHDMTLAEMWETAHPSQIGTGIKDDEAVGGLYL